jgi:hypothetical protein
VWDVDEADTDQDLLRKRRKRVAIRGIVMFSLGALCLICGAIMVLIMLYGVRHMSPHNYVTFKVGIFLSVIGIVFVYLASDWWGPHANDLFCYIIGNTDQVQSGFVSYVLWCLNVTFVSPPFVGVITSAVCLFTGSILMITAETAYEPKKSRVAGMSLLSIGLLFLLLSYKGLKKFLR